MASQEFHHGMMQLARTGRENATSDVQSVLFDRAAAAHATAGRHALLALRAEGLAADHARAAAAAAARPAQFVDVMNGSRRERLTVEAFNRGEADRLRTVAARHRAAADKRSSEGSAFFAEASAEEREPDSATLAAIEAGRAAAALNPPGRPVKRRAF